ncbi:MAG: hypothetical protein ACP5GJ_00965 [Nanopusillaceae archaeon]|jgi:hypothetical protein
MKKIKYFLFLLLLIFFSKIYSIRNPFAVFCEYSGGTYFVNSSGQYCIVDGKIFNAIDYYNGNVPVQYNFCSHFNLSTYFLNLTIYHNVTYQTYYCVYPNGTAVSPYSLIPINALNDIIFSANYTTNVINITLTIPPTINLTNYKNMQKLYENNYSNYLIIGISIVAIELITYILK